MARKALTAGFVEAVEVDKRTDFWDDLVRGLVLRVSETGVKSWTVVYTAQDDTTRRRLTLGKFPAVSLKDARAKALKTMAAIVDGGDPSRDRKAKREAMTVSDLGALFIDKYAKPNKRTWKADERILKREVFPVIGSRKVHAVSRRDLLDIIQAKADAGYGAQSRVILATVRKMFNWAVDEDYIEQSPASGIRPKAKAGKRDRVLSDGEIAAIWNALPGAALSDATRDIVRLLFLTGQRSGEVCGITRGEIDLDGAVWTLPGTRTKNELTHNVPLSDAALAIVADRIGSDMEDDAPLFSRIGVPIESNAISQAVRKRLQVTGKQWTPHDIRRTVATGMAGIGIPPHIVEASLNHISGFRAGVAGIYNRALYDNEKRNAHDRWAAHLDAIVAGKTAKVVPIKAGA